MKYLLALLLIISPVISIAGEFPQLTGRVVDEANILSNATESSLSAQLESHEKQTTNQVLVVTLSSLKGKEIEDFGYKLGRYWAIGQKGKNNGVLFIIAPNERATRIEVGYGLEGTLTDAITSQIIQTIVLPRFKQGDLEGGVISGTHAIISVLGGEILQQPQPQNTGEVPDWFVVLFVIALIILRLWGGFWIGGRSFRSSGGGGGFSGGGGSFGGGGSSGKW